MLIAGLVFAGPDGRRSGDWAVRLAPVGLLIGSVFFLAITATGRPSSFGPAYALELRCANGRPSVSIRRRGGW